MTVVKERDVNRKEMLLEKHCTYTQYTYPIPLRMTNSMRRFIFLLLFYLYNYPPDSQESGRGPNT